MFIRHAEGNAIILADNKNEDFKMKMHLSFFPAPANNVTIRKSIGKILKVPCQRPGGGFSFWAPSDRIPSDLVIQFNCTFPLFPMLRHKFTERDQVDKILSRQMAFTIINVAGHFQWQ